MDVLGEVMTDGGGWNGDDRGPLLDEVFDVGKAIVEGGGEILGELGGGDVADGECLGTDGPDGCDPGKAGAGMPLVGEVEPLAGAYDLLDCFAGFESKKSGVADEDRGIGELEHGDGIGRGGNKGGIGAEEFAEEDLGIGEGAARGGIGGDGFHRAEGVRQLNDELDGADVAERGDGAAGHDGEIGSECSNGNEAEVGSSGEEFFSTE